jgi:hypothetical protein
VQFERDFGADVARGLRIIDATEGGVRKRHTEIATLADALAHHGAADHADLGVPPPPDMDRQERLASVRQRVGAVRTDVFGVAKDSRRAKRLLEKMLDRLDDTPRVNRLIDEVYEVDRRVKSRTPAFAMVQHLNQTGILNRFRSDRSISLDDSLDAGERQKRQIQRDITNVAWLADAADQLGDMLDYAAGALQGHAKITRDADAPDGVASSRAKAVALICVDPARGALGHARDLAEPMHSRAGALRLTLERLARTRHVKHAVLLTHRPDQVRELLGDFDGLSVSIEPTVSVEGQ